MKKKLAFFIVFAMFLSAAAFAGIKLPSLVGDNMVLQQNAEVNIWGWAGEGSVIEISPSWCNKKYTAKTVKGRWLVKIKTGKGCFDKYELKIEEFTKASHTGNPSDIVVLKNILLGDVWLAGGQSNMEIPINGYRSCPIDGANDVIADACNYRDRIRFVTIQRNEPRLVPVDTCRGTWQESTDKSVGWCSATAYFFAYYLSRNLSFPVGIISCNRGGSSVESWLPRRILKQYADVDLSDKGVLEHERWSAPMIFYNGMLRPVENYTIKGFIFYQGCANVGRAGTYAERLADMVDLWRSEWGEGTIPFYYVEIAPYRYNSNSYGLEGALLREAQYRAQQLIPNSVMISTNDLVRPYEADNIHPADKRDVGKRLAWVALNRDYGFLGIAFRGPEYKGMKIVKNKILVYFNNADYGYDRIKGITGFEVAGRDGVYHNAIATASFGNSVITVYSDDVQVPVAVRYGFGNYKPGNLKNTRGLPAVPFRSE
ncbi:MAG: sialate O-acetylesterase [Bacteroidales bacterium]|jgi:sialate O-acetylesterase|nr:sialate O-acetylesterase [Bacteroidales bacterium]